MHFELVSPVEKEEEAVDPKAKKDPKAAVKKDAPFSEEEEHKFEHRKIYVEYKPDAEK